MWRSPGCPVRNAHHVLEMKEIKWDQRPSELAAGRGRTANEIGVFATTGQEGAAAAFTCQTQDGYAQPGFHRCRPCVIVSRGPQSAKSLGEPGFASRQVPPTPRGLHTQPSLIFTHSPRPRDPDDNHNPNPYTTPTRLVRVVRRPPTLDPFSDEVELGVLPPEHAVHQPDPTRAVASAHPPIAEAPCPPRSMPSRCDFGAAAAHGRR